AACSTRAELVGDDITIGSHSVVHPYAVLDASRGPIKIGSFCIVGDAATVTAPPGGLAIGDHSVLQVKCTVAASSIGEGVSIGPKAVIGEGSVVADGAIVQARVEVSTGSQITSNAIHCASMVRENKADCANRKERVAVEAQACAALFHH